MCFKSSPSLLILDLFFGGLRGRFDRASATLFSASRSFRCCLSRANSLIRGRGGGGGGGVSDLSRWRRRLAASSGGGGGGGGDGDGDLYGKHMKNVLQKIVLKSNPYISFSWGDFSLRFSLNEPLLWPFSLWSSSELDTEDASLNRSIGQTD